MLRYRLHTGNHALASAVPLLVAAALLLPLRSACQQTTNPQPVALDSDHDGMSDALEQALLERFLPVFSVSANDCAGLPAEFTPGVLQPQPQAENGTLYGQVAPLHAAPGAAPLAEIRYFHLWKADCGRHGHPLDDEHVSVLVEARNNDSDAAPSWKALDWYAAAHEATVCEVSQIARASALDAEDRGAHVWISPGKHASYFAPALCRAGCGADRCEKMKLLAPEKIINLGEPAHPMNRSAFIASNAWQLSDKMSVSNFPPEALARLNRASGNSILWFNPGRHPAQGIIAISSTTEAGIAIGETRAAAGISTGGQATSNALDSANASTGNALQKSYRSTLHALGVASRKVGRALQATTPAQADQSNHPPQ